MLLFLRDRLPASLLAEIALFDGRVFRAYLREYISEVYSPVYKRYFGQRHSLKYVTGGFHSCDLLASLPFYAAWSTNTDQIPVPSYPPRKASEGAPETRD